MADLLGGRNQCLFALDIAVDDIPAGFDAFNAKLQRRLARTAWAATSQSWYKNAAGLITNNWSSTTIRYWWSTRRANLEHYHKARLPAAPEAGQEVGRIRSAVVSDA